MFRASIPDCVWDRLEPILVELRMKRIRNLRLRMEGVLWRLRTGAPWRDLPTELGSWSTVFNFFNRWSKKGLWKQVFERLRGELDDEWGLIDSSYVKVHRYTSMLREQQGLPRTRRLLGDLAEVIPVNFTPAAMLMAIPPYFFSRRETSAISQWQIAFSMTAERNR